MNEQKPLLTDEPPAPPKESKAVQKMKLFTRIVSELGAGELLIKSSDELRRLIRGVLDTGKKGEITLTIKAEMSSNGVVELIPVLKNKVPEQPFAPNIFFATTSGDLSRDQPNQGKLFTLEEIKEDEEPEEEESVRHIG